LNLTEFLSSSHPPANTPMRENKNKSLMSLFMAAEFKMLKYFLQFMLFNFEIRGFEFNYIILL